MTLKRHFFITYRKVEPMNKQQVLDAIANSENGRVSQSVLFVGKHSQRSQLPLTNLLARMRGAGEVVATREDGETFYSLPAQEVQPAS
jgi:16S rRNA G1207 methylase RsmC